MWINKRKYENLIGDINQLRDTSAEILEKIHRQEVYIDQLMYMHKLKLESFTSMDTRAFCGFNRMFHEDPTTTIGDIDNLTFTELAEYVINGKPITRVREHEVTVCPKTEAEKEVEG